MHPLINLHTHQPIGIGELGLLNCMPLDEIPATGLFSIGMHPWYLTAKNADEQFAQLSLHASNPRCLAIGECGLDRLKGPDMKIQTYWLNQQANLAEQLQKPIIIHCVRAFDLLLQWLKQRHLQVPCIIHGFRKNPALLQQLLAFGCFFSFGWKGLQQATSIKSFEMLPSRQFFLETDDADDSIEAVYDIAAKLRQLNLEELKQLQIDNFQRIFNYGIS